jgi:N-acetylmuramoyl-L-alanine amidase-like protein
MAVLAPGVQHRLLAGKSRTPLDPRWITVHTMVGTVAGTEAFFSPSGRPYSHFGAGGDGKIRQWQDLQFRAASDKDGNPFSISIECEDHGPGFPAWSGSDVPRFTPAQADALVRLLSWLCHRFGLPKRAIGSSCPHERGIGWHRLGIDPWRQPNCLKWSKSRGKACPGDRRIAQLRNEIIPRVSSPPEVDDVTPQDHDKIKAAVHAVVRGEVQRLGQYLAAGQGNQAFNPQIQKWMGKAVTLPKVFTEVNGLDGVDAAAVATQVLAKLTPEAIAAAIPDDIATQVADQLAARLNN